MRSALLLASFVTALAVAPAGATAQTLSLAIKDGLVTLDAREVSVRQILERWSEIGGVTLVNSDTLAPTLVTLQLSNVTERAALETLLRPASGYVLGRRPDGSPGTAIDRIMIVPTSSIARAAAAPASVLAPAPAPMTTADADEPEFGASRVPQSAAQDSASSGQPGGRTGTAGAFGLGGIPLTADGQPARPASNPIRFSDDIDEQGNRLRAPSVPIVPNEPADQPAAKPQGPNTTATNPFGVTTGTSKPGVVVPAPSQPKP